jgi:hypothetical protein
MKARTLAKQRRRSLSIDNSNNAIVTRATIAIATMVKTPARHDEGDNKQ